MKDMKEKNMILFEQAVKNYNEYRTGDCKLISAFYNGIAEGILSSMLSSELIGIKEYSEMSHKII